MFDILHNMTTQTLIKKLNRDLALIRRDVAEIKEVIFDASGDADGEYRNTFVRRILNRARQKPIYRYTNRASFLKQLHAPRK